MGVCGQRHDPAALPPGKTRYPLYRRLCGPQGRSGRVREISPSPVFDPRTVQPVSESLYRLSISRPKWILVGSLTGMPFGPEEKYRVYPSSRQHWRPGRCWAEIKCFTLLVVLYWRFLACSVCNEFGTVAEQPQLVAGWNDWWRLCCIVSSILH